MSRAKVQTDACTLPGRRRWSNAWRASAVCAGLVLGVVLVYGQTLRYGFLSFDDAQFVSDESHVSGGFTWPGVVWAFTKGPTGDWCPLAMLSHMLDCQLYGLAPSGHHLTNLLLHAASAVTLFLVLWRMTTQRAVPGTDRRSVATQASGMMVASAGPSATTLWSSAMVAAIFALHPLHVESVAWIAERRDVLSGLFFMLTLAAYAEYVRHSRSLWRYLVVVAMLALGLLAKSMLVTTAPLLLLLDFWPLERFGRPVSAAAKNPRPVTAWRLVLEKLPLVALASAEIGMTLSAHRVAAPYPVLAVPDRLAGAATSYIAYLGQFFVPVDLSAFYGYPARGWPAWQVAAAVVLLLVITAAALTTRRSYPYVFVGWFWYLGMLLPVVQIIPFAAHARADRYTYLSQIGLTIALVWGARQLTATWPARRWILSVGSLLVLAGLMACAWRQTGYWQNDETLWKHALACDDKNVMAHYVLALAWKEQNPADAKAECRQALELVPGDRDFYFGTRARACSLLASLAAREGNIADARIWLEQAINISPDFALGHTQLGQLLAGQREFEEAESHFRRSIQLEPANPHTYSNLAAALAQAGRLDEAIDACRQAAKIDPSLGIIQWNLATYLARDGRREEAISHFRRVIELEPDNPRAYFRIANLLRAQAKRSEAVEFDRRGNQAGVRLAKAKIRRGSELVSEGKLNQAIGQFREAIEADGRSAQAHCHLADALAQQGKTAEAADQYRQALEIAPDFAPARQGLEKLPGR